MNDHCVAGGKATVPLAQKRIAEFLCGDTKRGMRCPHHERKAEELYFVVQRAQEEERALKAQEALERVVQQHQHATEAV